MDASRPARGVGRHVAVALALAGVALVWLADAPRDARVAQGLARELSRDLDRAFSGEPGARGTLFAAVDARVSEDRPPQVAARVELDGAPATHPGLWRAVQAQWNRYREAQRGDLPDLDRVGAGAAALTLVLRLESVAATDRVRWRATLVGDGSSTEIDPGRSWRLPDRRALIPPLLAIGLALWLGRALLSLGVGIWAGATLLALPSATWLAPLQGALDVVFVYLRRELVDSFRLEILGFIAALVALVGIVSRAGGLQGLVDRAVALARTARSAQVVTAGFGLVLFFDDYANCVLVGNTMRPLTDRLRVSREKLAYLVDSTAAPVAAVSLVSTWIAFQVSIYSPQLPAAGITESGYAIFVASLPYRFYCWLALFMVFAVAFSGRDFGPMLRAERRARVRGERVRAGARPLVSEALSRIEPAPGQANDWRVAAVPFGMTLVVTALRIFQAGGGPALLREDPAALLRLEGAGSVLFEGSGAGPILDGALAGLLSAVFLAASNRGRMAVAAGAIARVALGIALPDGAPGLLGLAVFVGVAGAVWSALALRGMTTARPHLPARELVRAGFASTGTLGLAFVLLLEAWMIGAVCQDLGTADYLVALLGERLPAGALPLLLFALASLVAFATGSSWSTMSILIPNVVALAAALGADSPLGVTGMVAVCVSAVLEGAVFGDHCSPISDTTVLSSVASGSDHLDHVRTQAPYALVVAGVAVLCGYGPLLWLGAPPPGLALLAGAGLLVGVLVGIGRSVPAPSLSGGDEPKPSIGLGT